MNTKNTSINWSVIQSIVNGVHYLLNQMIVTANSRTNAHKGDPKIGGHSSASTSALHILGALHLVVRNGWDWMAHKPHASPTDHAYHYLLNLFLDQKGKPFQLKTAEQAMYGLRAFPSSEQPYVFQSYHSHYDPDHCNFLPSGTVGIPPVVSGYMALAYKYTQHQGYKMPPAHFWSLIGDSEFREGSLFEAIPDLAEREVGSVTWIIDYNRQSLDGFRKTHPAIGSDDKRIEQTFLANGWQVIQVRHGQKRNKIFQKPNGRLFQNFFEKELFDPEMQILLQLKEASDVRDFIIQKSPSLKKFLKTLSDKELLSSISDLGGHDIPQLVQALKDSKKDAKKPCCIIAHTIKGWGLKMSAQGGNHSDIPSQDELIELRKKTNLMQNSQKFPRFKPNSPEDLFLKKRHKQLLKHIHEQSVLRDQHEKKFKKLIQNIPTELGIPLHIMSYPHTQWMLGQWASKMSRLSNAVPKDLKEDEKPFHALSKMLVYLSPDVGTSTNLSYSMDQKVYNAVSFQSTETQWGIQNKKSPNLNPNTRSQNKFLRFEIAEAAGTSCLAAFGKIKDALGIPIYPLMTVYDFFIKRALDQYFYALYWQSSFILAGTPSGITLSPEGAQHGWKSDFQIPGQIVWEPYFCLEVDWILTASLWKHFAQKNQNQAGVLIRTVTRGVDQKKFLHYLKTQARFKKSIGNQKLHPQNFNIGFAQDESQVESQLDSQILETIREQVLKGAYPLIHFEGYRDYQPGENVVNIFAMGALGTEACQASMELLQQGIYANVIIVTSPDLLLGSLADVHGYSYLKTGLGLDWKAPIVSVHDGEPGLLDNIGSIVGKTQRALAVRRHSMCGRPSDIYTYHSLDKDSIVQASLHILNF